MGVLLTGDVLPFATEVVDPVGGVPVNAGSMALTVTGPDGVTQYDGVVPAAGVGLYDVDHPATLPGRYVGRWVGTGANAGTDLQVFNVDDATSFAPLVGLDEVKDHLNIDQDDVSDDEELWRVAASASRRVEDETQLWHVATVVQTLPASDVLVLGSLPVVSITSVVQNGETTSADRYELQSGTLLASPTGARLWPAALGQVTVTYEAGTTLVPSVIREAVLATVKHIWRQQRGASRFPLQGAPDQPATDPRALPPDALSLLRPYARIDGVA